MYLLSANQKGGHLKFLDQIKLVLHYSLGEKTQNMIIGDYMMRKEIQ